MIDKQGVYELLERYHFAYEIREHPAVFTMEELEALDIPDREQIVKNLFLRDDKKRNYYLVTVSGSKTINLNDLSARIPSRKLSFASEEKLRELLMLERGHVTPLGLLNNTEKNVIAVFDTELQSRRIGVHPLENTATVFLAFEDLRCLIEDHGNVVVMCDMDERQQ